MKAGPVALLLVLGACGGEAVPVPPAPPPGVAATVEAGLRAAMLEGTGGLGSADPVYDRNAEEQGIVSERLEGPTVQVPLRGAQLQIPMAGLVQVSLELDPDGAALRLGYESGGVAIADRTGSPRAQRILEELLSAHVDPAGYIPAEAWEDLRARAAEAALRLGQAASSAEEAVGGARAQVETWDARFRKDFRTLAALRSAVLAATPDRASEGRSLYDVYRRCRLCRLRPLVTGGPGTASLLVCGPVVGVLWRDAGGAAARAFVDGPDGIMLEYGMSGALASEVLQGLFFARPFSKAGGKDRGPPAGRGGDTEDAAKRTGDLAAALRAVGAFHLLPRAGTAEQMLHALRLQPQPPPDLPLLAEQVADWIGASTEERARLLLAARGES